MSDEKPVKRGRGNPNWVKKDENGNPIPKAEKKVEKVVEEYTYPDNIIWTMLMQSSMQTWDVKTPAEVAKAAAIADSAMEEYKKRY